MLTYTISILRINQGEILAKDFTSDVDCGNKDVTRIQNDLLYICLFTNFAWWKTN